MQVIQSNDGVEVYLEGPLGENRDAFEAVRSEIVRLQCINPDAEIVRAIFRAPKLRYLNLISHENLDVSFVSELINLNGLNVTTQGRQRLDFHRLSNLRECGFTWRGEIIGIEDAQLEVLRVEGLPFRTLEGIANVSSLRELQIFGGRIHTLAGVASFKNVTTLGLVGLRSLVDITEIGECTQLVNLRIDTCRKLETIESLSRLSNLETLHLDNLGKIDSLQPLTGLEKLRVLSFTESTDIVDGNTKVVKDMKLERFAFQNRKHYDFTYDHLRPAGTR